MAIADRLCSNVLRGFASKKALLSAPLQTQRVKRARVCCDPWFFQDRSRFSSMPDVVRYQLGGETQLVIQQGDITQWDGDAIVNAANEVMLGGGGVDGAIHRAAGPSLVQACKLYPPQGGRCPTGDARVTLAYDLPCKWVVHTVGPVYEPRNANACAKMLSKAYRSSLAVANGIGAKSVAFPAISCGVYGYPLEAACYAAIRACFEWCQDVKEVHFVLFSSDTYNMWISQANKYLKPADSQHDDKGQQSEETMQSSEGAALQDQQVVDTLTGPKEDADRQAAQAVMEEQPVLEDSKPVAAPDIAGQSNMETEHESTMQSNVVADEDRAADDVDKHDSAPDSYSSKHNL